jgi:hypothetical protein
LITVRLTWQRERRRALPAGRDVCPRCIPEESPGRACGYLLARVVCRQPPSLRWSSPRPERAGVDLRAPSPAGCLQRIAPRDDDSLRISPVAPSGGPPFPRSGPWSIIGCGDAPGYARGVLRLMWCRPWESMPYLSMSSMAPTRWCAALQELDSRSALARSGGFVRASPRHDRLLVCFPGGPGGFAAGPHRRLGGSRDGPRS